MEILTLAMFKAELDDVAEHLDGVGVYSGTLSASTPYDRVSHIIDEVSRSHGRYVGAKSWKRIEGTAFSRVTVGLALSAEVWDKQYGGGK